MNSTLVKPPSGQSLRVRLIAASLGVLAVLGSAGCVSPRFVPKSQPLADLYEDGTPRQPAGPVPRRIEPRPVEAHPADEVLADDSNLPFIRASTIPKVNVFGEFGGTHAAFVPAGKAGFQQHTYVDEGFDADVAVDPTGQWMAFASTRHSRHSDIYLQRTGGLAVTRLTDDPADEAFPAFSPDGRRIAFCSNRSGNWEVFVMDIDGKNAVAVTAGAGHKLHPSFSPDGTRLVYCASGRDGQWELWVADVAGGGAAMIGNGLFPVWSPSADKDVIAFQRARQRGGRWFSLWTLELIEGEPRNETEIANSPHAALVAPSWSPDGTRLAFGTVVEPDVGGKRLEQDVWMINADGTGRTRLTDGRGLYAGPCWAGDGRVYFISDRGGAEAIWSARADGPNYSTAAIDISQPGHLESARVPAD